MVNCSMAHTFQLALLTASRILPERAGQQDSFFQKENTLEKPSSFQHLNIGDTIFIDGKETFRYVITGFDYYGITFCAYTNSNGMIAKPDAHWGYNNLRGRILEKKTIPGPNSEYIL